MLQVEQRHKHNRFTWHFHLLLQQLTQLQALPNTIRRPTPDIVFVPNFSSLVQFSWSAVVTYPHTDEYVYWTLLVPYPMMLRGMVAPWAGIQKIWSWVHTAEVTSSNFCTVLGSIPMFWVGKRALWVPAQVLERVACWLMLYTAGILFYSTIWSQQ